MNSGATCVEGPGKVASSAKPGWPGGGWGNGGQARWAEGAGHAALETPPPLLVPGSAWQCRAQEGIQWESDPSLAESFQSRFDHYYVTHCAPSPHPTKGVAFQVLVHFTNCLSIHSSICLTYLIQKSVSSVQSLSRVRLFATP